MSETDEEARPGLAPGSRSPAGTMFAALYGEPAPVPEDGPDAYSLFHDRSVAMGWLDDPGAPGLWGMNDAGQEHPIAGGPLVAWFQVGVEPVPADRPLPVQPFLHCTGDVVARLGGGELTAVQVLLPVEALDVAPRPHPALVPSLLTAHWFTGPGIPVRVTLDSGQVPSVPAAAAAMRDQLGRLEQDVFTCASHSLTEPAPLPAPVDDSFWPGPPHHRVTFHGTLAEWSPDAIGWLAGFLADLGARLGVHTPVLLTVLRDDLDQLADPQ